MIANWLVDLVETLVEVLGSESIPILSNPFYHITYEPFLTVLDNSSSEGRFAQKKRWWKAINELFTLVRFILLFEDFNFNRLSNDPLGSNLPTGKLLGHQKHEIIQKISEGTTPSKLWSLTTFCLDEFLLTPHEETPSLLFMNIWPSCRVLHLP